MNEREKVIERLGRVSYYFKSLLAVGWQGDADIYREHMESVNMARALLKEQEIGHWIFLTDCSNGGVYCSECNTKVFESYPFKKKLSYFCPHCGTRMEGEIERR